MVKINGKRIFIKAGQSKGGDLGSSASGLLKGFSDEKKSRESPEA